MTKPLTTIATPLVYIGLISVAIAVGLMIGDKKAEKEVKR